MFRVFRVIILMHIFTRTILWNGVLRVSMASLTLHLVKNHGGFFVRFLVSRVCHGYAEETIMKFFATRKKMVVRIEPFI